MKEFFKPTLFAMATLTAAAYSASEEQVFNIVHSSGQATNFFPTMQLENIQTGNLEFHYGHQSDGPGWSLKTLTLDLGTAGRLEVNGFINTNESYSQPMYRALVEDVWVYREILVEVQASEPFEMADVTLKVPEHISRTEPLEFREGPTIFQGQVYMEDVTPSKTMDVETVMVDDKTVQLNLLDRVNISKSAFVIETIWMGSGERDLSIPLDTVYYPEIQPIAIELESYPTPEGEEYDIAVTYEEYPGSTLTTAYHPLRMLLDDAYGTPY